MTISYKWSDVEQTRLLKTDTATPDLSVSFPVAPNDEYTEYLEWVAAGGVTDAFVAIGYEDLATSIATKARLFRQAVREAIESRYSVELQRKRLDPSYSIPAAAQTVITQIYDTYDAAVAAVESAADIAAAQAITVSDAGLVAGEYDNDGTTVTVP